MCWLLPTKGRIHQLQAFLDQCQATGISTPGIILVHADELAENLEWYNGLRLPLGWKVRPTTVEGMAAKIQEAYSTGRCDEAGRADWVGVLTDDMTPITPFWDRRLIDGLQGWNVISSDDCDQAPKRMEGATVWSRDLLDDIGYLAPPGLHHLFFDDVWESIGKSTACLRWMMDVRVSHKPKTYSHLADSTAQAIKNFHDEDEKTFRNWKKDGLTPACEAVLRAAEKHGVKVERPDLKGISLYVATPDGDGTLNRVYTLALLQTVKTVHDAGGDIDWGEMPYCADLCMARARLLGAFLKSRHTHLLMIDSDIGWNPSDVLRLIQTKLDFVGGAGPKKMYPLRYCIHGKDENGREMPTPFYEATQTLEVTGIGTGFLMITRACAERIVAAYPDLTFDPGEGQTEHAVFDPVIINKIRYSDDFAFCYRWRKIGGKVHVMPSIKLLHVGSHTFTGSLLEAMQAEPEIPLAAE